MAKHEENSLVGSSESCAISESINETVSLHSGPKVSNNFEISNSDVVDTFRLYGKRWFVLAAFSLLNLSNGWMWVTWSPLTALVAKHWNVTEGQVDGLSGIYMYVFVPTSFFSMWLVVNHLGLSKGLMLGAVLNCLGQSCDWLEPPRMT